MFQSGPAGGVLRAASSEHERGVRGGGARRAAQDTSSQANLSIPLTNLLLHHAIST